MMSTHEQHKLNNLMQLIKNEVQQNSQTAGQLQQGITAWLAAWYSSSICNHQTTAQHGSSITFSILTSTKQHHGIQQADSIHH
jgi:hypothetical protein